jgi:hypothetical protein
MYSRTCSREGDGTKSAPVPSSEGSGTKSAPLLCAISYLRLHKGAEAAAEFHKIVDHKGANWANWLGIGIK